MQYQFWNDCRGRKVMHLMRPRHPTVDHQNEIERWRRDSFRFGGKYIGFDIYFDTDEQIQQFLIWQGLQA